MDPKNILTFFNSVLDSLSKGSLIRKVMTFLFQLIGVLSFVGGVYFFFKTISYAPDFWFVVLLILFLATAFISFQVWFYRAKAIKNLENSEFTVIPIISNLLRAFGEIYAVFVIATGISGTLILWFSKYTYSLSDFIQYIPFISFIPDTFVGGLTFLLVTILIGFFVLLLTYFFAESILVFVQIAKNTRSLRKD